MARGLVEDAEHFQAAGREEKIVAAHGVLDDRPHRAAPVGVQDVARRDVDGVRVVDRPARRQPLARIAVPERDEVRDLLSLGIDDFEGFALPHDQGGPRLWLQMRVAQKCHEESGRTPMEWAAPRTVSRVASRVLFGLGALAEVRESWG